MQTRSTYKVLALLLMVALLLGIAVNTSRANVAPAEAEQSLEKVEAEVLDAISTKGSSDFVVEMAEHADLKAAYEIKDWSERGWYVYNTLKEVADRTQKPIIQMLDQKGIKYQSFFAGNEIVITAGEMTTLSQIAALDGVEHIRYPRTAYIDPITSISKDLFNFTVQSLDWGITDTNVDDFWSTFGMQGDGIVVANIDTGVQWNHPALDQSFKCGTNPSDPACWADPSNICGGQACDNNGHGTHTMGTMVGDDDLRLRYQVGMAPNAQWIACKGCESDTCSENALNACADWILAPNNNPDNRPNVVNNSWGGGGGDDWYLDQVKAWHAAGIFPAFSAGNSGPACSSLGSPGDYQESFASAAHSSSRTIASFSSRGPGDFGDNPYTKPNISAPGDYICSSVPGSGWDCTYSGTSMASPHSAGAVALLWSCNSSLIGNMEAIFEVLQDTADPAPAGTCGAPADGEGNYTYGYGYLNVLAAGQWVCSAGTITGSVTSASSPVEGATVTADNGAGVVIDTLTGADGIYTLIAPAGTYTVTATKYGFTEDIETGVVVAEGGTVGVDFTIEPLASTIVSGVVYDAGVEGLGSHGYPLYASIHITATGFDQTIYSDPITGEYSIKLASEIEHTFEVTSVVSGYEPFAETLTPTGATLTYNIGLGVDGGVCAAPGYQLDYDFFWSFEQTDGGFTPGGTTSFAWGDFTSGPMEGHSGTKGITTNPAGNYNPNELGYMLSPVIDLSGYGTNTPVIQWWDWKDIEDVIWDWARFDVTKDGGTTWTPVWGPVGGVHDTEYHQQTVLLDPSYNVSNFQFRFYFKSDGTDQYAGWYIDDIGIFNVPLPASTVVYSSNFDTDNGGFVASGTNSSWAWGAPTSGPGAPHSAPNVWATNLTGNYNDYEESYLTSPVIDLSAHAGLAPSISFYYWNDIQDERLNWGAVEVTKNGGASWTDVSGIIGDQSLWAHKTITLDPTYAVGNFLFRFYFNSYNDGTYPGWYIDDVRVSVSEPFEIPSPCVVIPGGAVAGYVTDEMTSEPLIGADVYSDTAAAVSFVLEDDPDNAGLYWVFQPTTSDPENVVFTASKDLYTDETATVSVVQDAVKQQDFALGTGELTFDPTEFEFTMAMGGAPATDTLTISNGGSAEATFELVEKDEGFTPFNIPAFTGELRVIDMETGASTLIGAFPGGAEVDSLAFPTGGSVDVPWLSEEPVSGTVPADGSVGVTITVDPSDLDQPGDYAAALNVKHNTPYTYPNIPVILHLFAPEDVGTINGTVNGLEACDINPAPIEGATVNFKQEDVIIYTTTTLANGYYSYIIPEGEYDIEVIAEGFVSQTVTGVDVVGESTVTQDFELRLLAPCLSAVPSELEKTLAVDQTGTETLTITNTGTVAADIELFEVGATSTLLSEGFEGVFPPTNWAQFKTNPSNTWEQSSFDAYEGSFFAYVPHDYDQDEWLLTPEIALAEDTLSFYSEGNTYWCRDAYDNCDLNVWLVVGDVGGGDDVFVKNVDEDWSDSWIWTLTTIDLESYLPGFPVRIGFQYIGDNGADVGLDSVVLDGVEVLDVPWLSEEPVSGTVPAGGSLPITVTFDATGLSVGDYFAGLRVRPDGAPRFDVPVTLHVLPVMAFDQEVTTQEDTPIEITLSAAGPEGVPLTYSIVDEPLHGTLEYEEEDLPVLTYIPDENWNGLDSFTFKTYAGEHESDPATVSITVTAVNDSPAAVDDSYTVNEDTTLTVAAPGVLENDTDAEDDPLTASLVDDVEHGTLTLGSDGSFVYISDPDYYGEDTFTYVANDGFADSDPATVIITISNVNDSPAALDDSYTVNEDTTLTVDAPGVLENDTDAEDDPLTASPVDDVEHGTLTLESDGSFVYIPDPDYCGEATFTYVANDGFADSDPATVTINIRNTNDSPVAMDDFYETDQDTTLNVLAPGVLENDVDPDPTDQIRADLKTAPLHGSIVLNEDGAFTYVPQPGFFGQDTFTYSMVAIPSGNGLQAQYLDEATVTIVVKPAHTLYLPLILK